MTNPDLASQFNQWAPTYDRDVQDESGFPFAGYERILDRVVRLTQIRAGVEILELGAGTGNLTRKLVNAGAAVWALDFSDEMLAIARQKVPEARFERAAVQAEYPPDFRRKYSRIVSTYTFHELPMGEKLKMICRLADEYLAPGGSIVIGDIGFTHLAALEAVRKASGEVWDDEYYWIQNETVAALKAVGMDMIWEQISSCGVVMKISTFSSK